MGFMDKAKRMAEQAQQKLDQAQGKANEGQANQTSGPGAGAVRYDEHGRQVPDDATEAQQEAGIPVGESLQAEPGTIPGGQSGDTPGGAHETVEGGRPPGVDHPGEGQPPAGRVETSGAAGNAEGNQAGEGNVGGQGQAADADRSPDPARPGE